MPEDKTAKPKKTLSKTSTAKTKPEKPKITTTSAKKKTGKVVTETVKDKDKKVIKKKDNIKSKKQYGIIISTLLIVLSILGLAGGLGYYVYELNNQVEALETEINGNKTRYTLLESQQNDLTNRLQPVLSQLEPQPEPELQNVPRPDPNSEAWYGSTDADIVMVVYGDPECPFCASGHETLLQLIEQEGKDNLAMTYRHYPLRTIHPDAEELSVNMECVRNLRGNDAFWSSLEKVYNQELTVDNFATQLGEYNLSSTDFNKCLDSQVAITAKDRIKANEDYLIPYQVGTPTIALYDMNSGKTKTIVGALPLPQFQQKLNEFRGV